MRANNANQAFTKVKEALGDAANQISDQHLIGGEPAQAVIDFVENTDGALIVVGSRGLSRVRGLLIGSFSQRLMQLAPGPVMIIR